MFTSQTTRSSHCVGFPNFESRRLSIRTRHVGTKNRNTLSYADVRTTDPIVSNTETDPKLIVDELLEKIKDTDRGRDVSDAEQEDIDGLIGKLSEIGKDQEPAPVDNPVIFDDYDVAYVSPGNKQEGQPAGGRFRASGLAKWLFSGQKVCQSILKPDLVVNKVEFRILGLIPGSVGLRGTLAPVENDRSTVEVKFEVPEIGFPGGIFLHPGKKSKVVLATPYLDDRVRLGKGSRGSLFVFTRGGDSVTAGMDKVGLQETTPGGWALVVASMAAILGGGGYLCYKGPVPAKLLGAFLLVIGFGMLRVLPRGGGRTKKDEW